MDRDNLPSYVSTYQPQTGQVIRIEKKAPVQPTNAFYPEITTRSYDASGNMTHGMQEIHGSDPHSVYVRPVRIVNSRSYYSADERLRYYQESDISTSDGIEFKGVWEEYRYDALGRRILVHSNRNHLCAGSETECTSHVTRMVWSGDQLLWELRTKAGPTDDLESESSEGDFYGVVSYTHATGIDRPLVIHKRGEPAILPHENWRGQFALGTYASGQVSDCPESSSLNCHKLAWPGYRTTAWHLEAEAPDVVTWYGGLVDGMRDASGPMYMRNRYYDPQTGQFTQPDPIGLAGGLNSYGFAAGDPVSYSDPYGLKVCFSGNVQEVRALRAAAEEATGAAVWLDKGNCVSGVGSSMNSGLRGLRNRLAVIAGVEQKYEVSFGTRGGEADAARSLSGSGAVKQSYIYQHCSALDCPVHIQIGSGWATGYQGTVILGMCMPWNSTPNTLAQQFTHEVLGHGFEHYAFGAAAANAQPEMATIRRADNVYLLATGQPPRCAH